MRPKEWTALLGLGLIWGTSYLLIKVAVRDFPPATLTSARLGLAGLLLASLSVAQGRPFPRSARRWAQLVLLGGLSGGVPISLIAWGERTISSGAASILNATTPLWAVLFSYGSGEQPPETRQLLGVVLGFLGVAVLVGADRGSATQADLLGAAAVVVASALYAWGILYARRTFLDLDPVVLATGSLLGGAVALLPLAAMSPLPARPSLVSVGSLLTLSVFGSAVAYLLYYYLVLNTTPTQTALVTYLTPATAVLWGWLLLGEPVGIFTVGGLAVILAGIALVNKRPRTTPTASGSADGLRAKASLTAPSNRRPWTR